MFSLEKCLFISFVHLLIRLFVFLLSSCRSSLYFLDINPLSDILFANRTIIWSSNLPLWTKGIEIKISKRHLHSHIYWRIIHNIQGLETIYMYILDGWIKKIWHIDTKGMNFIVLKGRNRAFSDNMDEPEWHHKWYKPDIEGTYFNSLLISVCLF